MKREPPKYKVGDLVGIGWNGKLKCPNPAIVIKVLDPVSISCGSTLYVVRPVKNHENESWCDYTHLTPWVTDK